MNRSHELLERYSRTRDQEAFRELVADYFGLVRSTALRRLNGNASLALDIVQVVFSDLARQAHRLPQNVMLGGWLHQHTCFTAAKFVRAEARRMHREQEALDMKTLGGVDESLRAVTPVLDEAIQELPSEDRCALILRYIEGRDLRAVGQALNVSDDAAQKRVQRALEKLRVIIQGKGVGTSTALLITILGAATDTAIANASIDRVSAVALSEAGPVVAKVAAGTFAIKVAVALLVFMGIGTAFWCFRPTTVMEVGAAERPSATRQVAEAKASSKENRDAAEVLSSPAQLVEAEPQPFLATVTGIKVWVTDEATGLPISGATVRHVLSDRGQGRPGDPIFATNGEGMAVVPVPEGKTDKFQLSIFHTHYAGWISIWEPGKGEVIPTEHKVRLTPGVRLGGIVVNNVGEPISNVDVKMNRFWSGGEPIDRSNHQLNIAIITNRTDSEGRWAFNHAPEKLLENVTFNFSHPDYAQTNKQSSEETLPLLKAQAFKIALQKGTMIVGNVRETNGAPVAKAKVSFGRPNMNNRQETFTDEQGSYEFRHAALGNLQETEEPISVLASGFAPQVQRVKLDQESMEVNFILTLGRTIRGKVVNESGSPISDVRVARENNQFEAVLNHEQGIVWSTTTDSEGRFEWSGAPNAPQTFYFGHGQYAQLRGKLLGPSEVEHLITLQKRRTVKGIVKSASTGEPIPLFFVSSSPESIKWASPSETPFSDGVFEIGLDEQGRSSIQIRAQGYYITNYFSPKVEGEVIQAFLQPSESLFGVVYDGTGQPVSGVEVAAIPVGQQKMVAIAKGKFARTHGSIDNSLTDRNGEFRIEPATEVSYVVAVSPQGYAEITLDELQRHRSMVLKPWGRVEGCLKEQDRPLTGRGVLLSLPEKGADNLRLDYTSFKTDTGPNGEFAFEMVPPRLLQLATLDQIGPRSFSHANQTNFVVQPGQTQRIEIKEQPHLNLPQGSREAVAGPKIKQFPGAILGLTFLE